MVRAKRYWLVLTVGAVLLTAGWASLAQEQTTTEKIKNKVGSAVQSIKKGAVRAEDAIKEQYARAKDAVMKMGVEARVYSRLHWDKALVGAKIDLSSPSTGVITVTGTVADAKAKAKAVELTQDTVGVTQVNDHLTVLSTASSGGANP
jgi:osmotically-inducible protein OsmY